MTRNHARKHPSPAAMSDLGPNDEAGTPDEMIEECDCGVLFRVGGWHRCKNEGRGVEWAEYTA